MDKKNENRVLFLLVGLNLSIKLSYLNGSLKGTETYYGVPDDEYWLNYYGVIPKVIEVYGSVGIVAPNGYFLFWQNEDVEATEMVGKGADHMPDKIYAWKELNALGDLDAIGDI